MKVLRLIYGRVGSGTVLEVNYQEQEDPKSKEVVITMEEYNAGTVTHFIDNVEDLDELISWLTRFRNNFND